MFIHWGLLLLIVSNVLVNSIPLQHGISPILSGKFEGDIDLSQLQLRRMLSKTGLINTNYRWSGKVIPYQFNSAHSAYDKAVITSALREIESKTCIRFVPKTNAQVDYISIIKGNGCYSSVGRRGGRQELSLGDGCINKGIAIHELIHAIGFWHMHSASNRDKFIKINYENMDSGNVHNFLKYSANEISDFGVPFDYWSIMMYSKNAFSNNGRDTITTFDPAYQNVIGQKEKISADDARRIRNMYGC